MTSSIRLALAAICATTTVGAFPSQEGPNPPRVLRVEARLDPIAVDEARPRFSWEIDDPRRGAAQSAYQVIVASNPVSLRDGVGDMWDSRKVLAVDATQVEYDGKPLAVDRPYFWSVRSWDAGGRPSEYSAPATFHVAPKGDEAFNASWIRAGRAADSSTIGYKSARADAEDAWPWVQLDFGGEIRCTDVRLHPARVDGDATKPGPLFPLRVRVYSDVSGRFENKAFKIADYEWQDVPNAGAEPLHLPLATPYTLRYLRIVATKIQKDGANGYAMALGEIEVLDGATNIAPRAQVTVGNATTEPGWSPSGVNDGALVAASKTESVAADSMPRLRGSFVIDDVPLRALLHTSALGAYELTVNGLPVGDARLAPGWTDDAKRVAFQTHDVAKLLQRGENVIGVQLAPGRNSGADAREPAFYAQCDVALESGKRLAVRSDGNWRWNRGGPLVATSLRGGETRDSRLDVAGWDQPRFQGADWRPVEIASDVAPALFAQRADPVRAIEELPALSVRTVGPNRHVVDFGRVVTGVARARVDGPAGAAYALRHARAVDAQGGIDARDAQVDRHSLRGGPETIEARFALHDFRYVELEGPAQAPDPSALVAVVIGADCEPAGTFTCSDDALNAAYAGALRALRSSFVAAPTDGGRIGAAGTVQVVAPFALHALDASNFLAQWLGDVRGGQAKDGRFPDFAPGARDDERGTPGWADAGVTVPWEIYLRTHDLKLLRSSAGPSLAWVKWITSKNPDRVWRNERGADRGDPRRADSAPCDDCDVRKDLHATAWYAHAARVAAKSAFAVGDARAQVEAHAIAESAAQAFRATFVKGDRLEGDAQGAYALALDFDLCESPDQAQRFADRLAARVREQGGLTCGDQATHRALIALSRHGHHELAIESARKLAPGSIAVGEWLVREIAGLQLVDDHADSGAVAIDIGAGGSTRSNAEGGGPWSRIRFAPRIGGGLTHASAEHRARVGRIASSWKLEGDALAFECAVPPGSTAVLDLPTKDAASVELDGAKLADSKALKTYAHAGSLRIEMPSGSFRFRSAVR